MLDTLEKSTVELEMLESVLTMRPTQRVERLRETYLSLKPTVSIDRARIETRIMSETEGDPIITRRGKFFAALVREVPIEIYPDELLVGYSNIKPRSFSVSPGPGLEARLEEGVGSHHYNMIGLDVPEADLSDEEKRELKEELIPYWRGKDRIRKAGGYGHNIIGYDRVLEKGFQGIVADAEERLAGLDPAEPEEAAKIPFIESVVMVMKAASELGRRFAARAREVAQTESDDKRKAELLRMAEVCDQVPAGPARTFHEALQSCYFTWLLSLWETSYAGGQSIGRMDQYLHSYYERDIREGRITREDAQELVDCCLIKLNHAPPVASVTVGGVEADGSDATNDLSYMFIEGMMHTRLRQPYFSVQVHSKMPDDLLLKACQLCSLGTGHPEFINTDVMIGQALARGTSGGPAVTLEDARSAAPIGCLEMGIPGKDSGYLYFEQPNLAACMDLVMTNGVRRSDKVMAGVETGDPRQFSSFEEVQDAYRKQLTWMRRNIQIAGNKKEQAMIECAPTPYESSLIEGCIEKGMCREEGGAHYNFNIGGAEIGSSDAGDSLAAVKRLVFDEKKITMAELCDALDHDFDGYDDIRKLCLAAPKFGNDDDYVDEQKAWVLHQWIAEFTKMKNLRGGHASPGGSVMWGYVGAGARVGALPSGRLAGKPLADASSPSPGKDVKGPTAVLKSMGKIDNVEILGGIILNMRIDPAVFKSRDGVKRLADLIRTFVDQKIYHVQINIVSSDTLRAAQDKPEKYRDLMVKVAGYNAFFTQLSRPLQESVIARTEHGL